MDEEDELRRILTLWLTFMKGKWRHRDYIKGIYKR